MGACLVCTVCLWYDLTRWYVEGTDGTCEYTCVMRGHKCWLICSPWGLRAVYEQSS